MIKKIVQNIPKLLNKKPVQFISVNEQGLNRTLEEEDAEIFNRIAQDAQRQKESINLVSNENTPSLATMQAVGTIMNAKYSEGYPGQRYYGGTEHIDQVENLCQKRALEAFNLKSDDWGVNVQAISCTMANFAAVTGLLQPHQRIMSLKGSHGGNFSCGEYIRNEPITAMGRYYEVVPYMTTKEGIIDYERLQIWAKIYKPKIITMESHAHNRNINWKILREISDLVGATLIADISEQSGLIAAQVIEGPFEYADIVTTSTQSNLRGNRGALIFYKVGTDVKTGKKYQYKDLIDQALFPGLQGGPHNHSITGIAHALKEVNTDYFKEYAQQQIKNNQVLCEQLQQKGYQIVTNGSDHNLFVVDLRNHKVNGFELQMISDQCQIQINKVKLPLDKNYDSSSGVKLCASYMTSRGCVESDFKEIANLFDESVEISMKMVEKYGYSFSPSEFRQFVGSSLHDYPEVQSLKQKVKEFSSQFPLETEY